MDQLDQEICVNNGGAKKTLEQRLCMLEDQNTNIPEDVPTYDISDGQTQTGDDNDVNDKDYFDAYDKEKTSRKLEFSAGTN